MERSGRRELPIVKGYHLPRLRALLIAAVLCTAYLWLAFGSVLRKPDAVP